MPDAPAITISINSTLRSRVPRKLLETACIKALQGEGIKRANLELHLVGDARMKSWNAEYLNHDYTTDVLSFELGEDSVLGLMGMLVICKPFAQRQAKQRGISVGEELARYAIHGTLHLLGYDDHDDTERAAMWEVQEALVASVMRGRSR